MDELSKEVANFQDEAKTKMEAYRGKGMEKLEEAEAELRALYERRRELLEDARHTAGEYLAEAKHRGQRAWDDALRSLDRQYDHLRNELSRLMR